MDAATIAAIGVWAQVVAAVAIAHVALRQLKHEQDRRRDERKAAEQVRTERRQRQVETETLRVCRLL